MAAFDLERYGIHVHPVLRNPAPAILIERALAYEGASLTDTGALATRSGAKTGRSPQDKRVVDHADSRDDIWWGNINIRLTEESFNVNHQRAVDYLNTRDYVYVIDGFAGWDPKYRIKVRVICSLAYHALFMHNMLIRPTAEELVSFGEPDLTIVNSGQFPANLLTKGMDSGTSIDLSFEQKTIVILGTMYAGEMKKGVFTVMHYLMPKMGVFSMHCSANEGPAGDVSLFFGLSGTGKTTLSADPHRRLIGDDEHCWSSDGVLNIEGGCYAKCVNLSEKKEPEIWRAIRFGSLLENVVIDQESRQPDYTDISITENTRVSYPIEFIDHAKIPCQGGHPKNVIFLTCDAFGVLPPVARLTPAQAMYHFMSGYTAKVAGTEVGITEPKAAFSTCFSAPFLVLHPSRYAEMLAAKLQEHRAQAWLINTGWSGGAYGAGQRIALPYTRAIIDAIHDGSLLEAPTVVDDVFGLHVPTAVRGVPSEILLPRQSWADRAAYDRQVAYLAGLFTANFRRYEKGTSAEILAAGPRP